MGAFPEEIERRCKVLSDGSLVFRVTGRKSENWIDLGKSTGFPNGILTGFHAENTGVIIAERGIGEQTGRRKIR